MWHDLYDKELNGTHGLGMAQAAPLEGADEVICPGGNILVHVHAYGVWSPGDNAEPGAPPIASDAAGGSPAPLLFFRADVRGLERTRGLAVWYTCGSREPIGPEKLREPTAFRFYPARRHQVPHVLVPGWCGCRYGFFVGVCKHNVVDEADFGNCPLHSQCLRTLVLVPELVVPFHIGFKAVQGVLYACFILSWYYMSILHAPK